jgi:hypothetical protein
MSAITGETTFLKSVRSRAVVLHDDSFVEDYDKDGNMTICKVRGITLNYKNSLTINFDTIKDMVINNRDDVKTVRDDFKITRDHRKRIIMHTFLFIS